MRNRKALACWTVLAAIVLAGCAEARPIRPADIEVPKGFKIEAAVRDLAAPTMVAFDDQRRMLIAESGYRGGGNAKVTRIEANGRRTVLVDDAAFGAEKPLTSVAFHEGRVYVAHAGTVSIVEEGGRLRNIITGLPGQGDHQANQIVFRDGFLYLSIGTVTNSGVVGPDNAVFGWLTDPTRRQLHEVPCRDIVLTDAVFDSENPLGNDPSASGPARTPPTAPSSAPVPECRATRSATAPCCGPGPTAPTSRWWRGGSATPYGLEIGPDGGLYVTMHGFDARGSRPIEDAWDCVYRIEQGA